MPNKKVVTTVDVRNPANHFEVGSLSHYFQSFIHPTGGFFPGCNGSVVNNHAPKDRLVGPLFVNDPFVRRPGNPIRPKHPPQGRRIRRWISWHHPRLGVLSFPSLKLTVKGHRKNRYVGMGVSLNGGTPKTPQNDHF